MANELSTTLNDSTQYIVIRLGTEQYGIDIRFIDNIVRMQQITRVPKVPAYLKGVINLRGEVIPVMSLRLKMGLSEDEIGRDTRIIILKTDAGDLVGIIVDQVNQVLTIDSNNVEKVRYDDKKAKSNGSFVSGVGHYEGGLVSILDLEAVVSDKEAKAKGVVEVDARILIQNDVKLLVQAECESANYYLTSDSRSRRMYEVLKDNGKLTFDFTDIHIPFSTKFGMIDFAE